MTRDDWLEITSRLAVGTIPEIEIGAVCGPPVAACVPTVDSPAIIEAPPPPTPRIWSLSDPSVARFGVRVQRAPDDLRPIAARLVAAAMERHAYPVILSHVHRSGFEHLGFRVERIHAGSAEEAKMQEDELAALWALAIIVDLEDVAAFT